MTESGWASWSPSALFIFQHLFHKPLDVHANFPHCCYPCLPIMQSVPAQQPLITRPVFGWHLVLWILALTNQGCEFSRWPRFLQSANDSTTRQASGDPGAPVTAEQAKKHFLKNKVRGDEGVFTLFLQNTYRLGCTKIKRYHGTLWFLLFLFMSIKVYVAQDCSLLLGFPIKNPEIIHSFIHSWPSYWVSIICQVLFRVWCLKQRIDEGPDTMELTFWSEIINKKIKCI